MTSFLHDLPDGDYDELPMPDPDCFFCGGTGLAPNGWDDCPECMPDYSDADEWEDDDDDL